MSDRGIFIIRTKRPAVLDDSRRASIACFIASVMGDSSSVSSKQATSKSPDAYPWEVTWDVNSPRGYGNTGDLRGVWLSQHGVFISDAVETSKLYQIVGYCAYQGIPWFGDSSLLAMQKEH